MKFLNLQLTTTKQFKNKEEIQVILDTAKKLKPFGKGKKYTDILKNKVIANLFYEPSTRTKLSFQTAIMRLGAKMISENDAAASSLKKWESIEDTMRMVEQYADLIVMRHPEKGIADKACAATDTPFINAWDWAWQHPTQALLDMYTIQREQGKIDWLKIALVWDLKNGRTVHSLIHLLKFYNIELVLVSPDALKMPETIVNEIKDFGLKVTETNDLKSVMSELDVIYMTRIQKERFEFLEDYFKLKDSFILTSDLLDICNHEITILHPLPRVNEIPKYVDSHKWAAFFRQAWNGVYVRMALICLALWIDVDKL